MNKKIFLFLTLVLLAGCGFTPMLKDFDVSRLNIQAIKYSGNNELIYLIKTYLNINENNNQGLILQISISETSSSSMKNSSGVTTEENFMVNANINVSNNKQENLLSDTVSASKRVAISNNLNADEETKKIQRNNLTRDLAQKIKFKLMMIAKQTQ